MKEKIQSIYRGALGAIRFSKFRRVEISFSETQAFSLKYVVSGTEHYQVAGKEYCMGAGQMLLFSAGHSYLAYTDNNQLNEGFCIDLEPEFVAEANLDFFGEAPVFQLTEEFGSLKVHQPPSAFGEQIRQLYQRKIDQEPLIFEESLNELMLQYLYLRKDFSDKMTSIPTVKRAVKQEIFQKVLYAQEYIHANKTKAINLEGLAKAVGLSKFYFQRLFVRVFGLSPSQYLEKIRMEEAIGRIKSRKQSITEISFSLGYNDITYFSRRFKKFYGKAPRQVLKDIG